MDHVKLQFRQWDKIFTNHVLNKGLISRLHKEPPTTHQQKSQTMQLKNVIFLKKMHNSYFSKEDIQMAEKHMK